MKQIRITYRMLKKNESAETSVELPISEKRYVQLTDGLDGKVWTDIRTALVALTRLQGYSKLGSWNVEFEIEEV